MCELTHGFCVYFFLYCCCMQTNNVPHGVDSASGKKRNKRIHKSAHRLFLNSDFIYLWNWCTIFFVCVRLFVCKLEVLFQATVPLRCPEKLPDVFIVHALFRHRVSAPDLIGSKRFTKIYVRENNVTFGSIFKWLVRVHTVHLADLKFSLFFIMILLETSITHWKLYWWR